MFNKKRCKKCGEKNNSKARFCSTCGFNFERGDSEDYGMLGKDDFTENSFNDPFTSSFFGGFSEKSPSGFEPSHCSVQGPNIPRIQGTKPTQFDKR